MNERVSDNIMADSGNLNGSLRRRSPRLSSPPQANVKPGNKMAVGSVAVKRSITVRKIAPRKTVAPSEHNKENTPRRSGSIGSQKTLKVSTPGPVLGRGGSSSAKKKKKEATMPSPILPSTPPPAPLAHQPVVDPEDAVWSQKVRRSYSRLSDRSLNSPDSRDNLFGFDKLSTPEVGRRVGQPNAALEVSGSLSALNSFTTLLEAEDGGSALPEPDTNIPGVAMGKEKRRRRKKVQQIDDTEVDALAAMMNAEFDEAEVFELVVE